MRRPHDAPEPHPHEAAQAEQRPAERPAPLYPYELSPRPEDSFPAIVPAIQHTTDALPITTERSSPAPLRLGLDTPLPPGH